MPVPDTTGLTVRNEGTGWKLYTNGLLYIFDQTVCSDRSEYSMRYKPFYEAINKPSIIKVVLDDSITAIGNYTFYQIPTIKEVVFPSALSSIGTSAFKECTKLASVIIPSTVLYIGEEAFRTCIALKTVEFDSATSNAVISHKAFYGCTHLQRVYLPDNVTFSPTNESSSKGYFFYDCLALENVRLPSDLTVIGFAMFGAQVNKYMESLTAIDIPISVKSIEANAFKGCLGTIEVYYPGTETEWSKIRINSTGNNPLIKRIGTTHYSSQYPDKTLIPSIPKTTVLSANVHSITFDTLTDLGSLSSQNRGYAYDENTEQIITNGLTNRFNTWDTYHLIPVSRPVVTTPKPKFNFVTIPGADGVLDFSEALDGKIHFEQRTGSWEFYVAHEEIENYDWISLWSQLLADLHGNEFAISLSGEESETPMYYFGRVWLNEWRSDPSHSKVVIDYNLSPYRYPSKEAYESATGGSL